MTDKETDTYSEGTDRSGCLDCGNEVVADGLCSDCHEYYEQYEVIR